jgi:hypothetical protein
MVKLPIKLCGNDPQYCPCGNIHGQTELDAVIARLRPFTIYFTTKASMLVHLVGENCPKAIKCRSMIEEVEKFEIYDPLKAARWLGYAIRLFEEVTGLSNEVTRAWVRKDVTAN